MNRPAKALRSAALLGLLVITSTTTSAQFTDNGFINPKVRTDYLAVNKGTASNPLVVGSCIYPGTGPAQDAILLPPFCAPLSGSLTFTQSNFFSQNSPGSTYWTISANNETPHFSALHSGPPNQSITLFIPQQANNLMEFTLLTNSLPGETAWRAHMIVDHTPNGNQNPLGPDGIAFLGLGADKRRGNSTNVGTLQGPSLSFNLTTFKARIWDKIYTPGGAALMYVHAYSQWPTSSGQMRTRGVFIQLYHEGLDTSSPTQNCTGGPGVCKGLHRHWNWRFPESFYFPGADYALIDAEDVAWACNGTTSLISVPPNNTDVTVLVNWTRIFRCMSDNGLFDDPMPQGSLPLLGVHWAVETTGINNAVWASVHEMTMHMTAGTLIVPQGQSPVIPLDWQDPTTTEAIRAHFWDGCLESPACTERNLDQFLGNYRDLDYIKLNQPIGIARELYLSEQSGGSGSKP